LAKSIDELGQRARQRLKQQGYTNVEVRVGNGYSGWPEHAPFDKVIVTAAPDLIPPPLINQLKARHLPDVAIVDLHLRGGERSDSLIGRLREEGVRIIMFSGSFELASLPSIEGAIILEKPVSEAQLIAHLSPLIAKKATR
jgi:hypothetical protein